LATSRIAKGTLLALAIALGLLSLPTAAANPGTAERAVTTAAQPAGIGDATSAVNRMNNLPIHGAATGGHVFRGTVDLVNFKSVNGRLVAVGSLSGTLRNSAGAVIGRVTDFKARFPLQLSDGTNIYRGSAGSEALAGTCDILHLKVGAIDLNLLGLVVHLDPIKLDITAQAGPGNLLGNLLCAVTHLLDNTGVSDVLVDLLRAIRDILNGI